MLGGDEQPHGAAVKQLEIDHLGSTLGREDGFVFVVLVYEHDLVSSLGVTRMT